MVLLCKRRSIRMSVATLFEEFFGKSHEGEGWRLPPLPVCLELNTPGKENRSAHTGNLALKMSFLFGHPMENECVFWMFLDFSGSFVKLYLAETGNWVM